MQLFDPAGPAHASPSTPAHCAVPAPHAAPTVAPAIMQVPAPMLTTSAPTQFRPALQVCPSHGWPVATSAWHVRGLPTQVWPWPQLPSTHGSPIDGIGAHAPQMLLLSRTQNALWHWPLNAHGAPIARVPAGVHATG